MAHEQMTNDHMVSGSNITPWHRLGTVVAGQLTSIDALEKAELSWQVLQEPIYDGDMKMIPTHVLNRREDTREVLGVVGKDFRPVQNAVLLEIAEALVQTNLDYVPVIETAGSLRNGRIVWALVRTGERTFADSPHRSYLLLSNAHDGTRALRGTLTDVRVVCNNTLTWAETSKAQLMVRHSKNVEVRIKEAIELLGWANEATDSTFKLYETLASARIQEEAAIKTFEALIEEDLGYSPDGGTYVKVKDDLVDLFRNGAGNSGETAFDGLNAVTDWVDHQRNFREGADIDDRRFTYSLMGPGAIIKRKAAKRFGELVA